MCASDCIINGSSKDNTNKETNGISTNNSSVNNGMKLMESTTPLSSSSEIKHIIKRRRSKRDRNPINVSIKSTIKKKQKKKRNKNNTNNNDGSSILATILPSLIGIVVGICALAAKLGFRGRATVAGIDLGTTNSVICVQAPSKSVGEIVCIPDAKTNSSIIPSVVSFVSRKNIIIGSEAKDRIDTYPHSTVYHAKRIIGRRYDDDAVSELQKEVEFEVFNNNTLPYFNVNSRSQSVSPEEVGSYVLKYLLDITSTYFGYSSITSAVITIPAEFTAEQRIATVSAYKLANIKVVRILEEPTAAALAYGLDKKEGVEHVLVYDFGGGTLDVSVLRIGQNGYVDVMGSAGDSNLGGADFDDAIVQYILNTHDNHNDNSDSDSMDFVHRFHHILKSHHINEEQLLATCSNNIDHSIPLCTISSLHGIAERIKIQLSSNANITSATEYCLSFDLSSSSHHNDNHHELCNQLNTKHQITMSSSQYHDAVKHLYTRTVLPIRKVLHDLDLEYTDIDEVVMVGGTTRMLRIRELVQKELDHIQVLNTEIDPDLTVAYGAASVID